MLGPEAKLEPALVEVELAGDLVIDVRVVLRGDGERPAVDEKQAVESSLQTTAPTEPLCGTVEQIADLGAIARDTVEVVLALQAPRRVQGAEAGADDAGDDDAGDGDRVSHTARMAAGADRSTIGLVLQERHAEMLAGTCGVLVHGAPELRLVLRGQGDDVLEGV